MKVKTSIISTIGPAHIDNDIPNQDAVLRRIWHKSWLSVVCDGMGSRKHADIGSKLACLAVLEATKKNSFDSSVKDFVLSVNYYWLELLKHIGIAPQDACSTCLIAWGDYNGNTRLFQLGDGAIFFQTNKFGRVQKIDNNFSNETNALGVSQNWRDWHSMDIKLSAPSHGIALMTDGISEDLTQEELFLKSVLDDLKSKTHRIIKKQLKKELLAWRTPYHSDDKSIGVVLWS